MKFACDKENLLTAVQIVQRAVSLKNPLPILGGIKFETENERVVLSATDLEMGIRCSFNAEITESGSSVLPAKVISELIRRLPDLPIFIESDSLTGSTTVKYGQSEASINGYPVEEFPDFPMPESEIKFILPGAVLKDMVRQVVYAAATDENRPVFTGVLLEAGGGEMSMVATDTHRLAWRKINLEEYQDLNINLIIPGKTLNELVKISGSAEQNIQITVTENQVLFNNGDVCLISRLIGGQFPNYRQVIPGEYISRIRVSTRELAEATERAALLTRDGSPIIRLKISDNTLVVSVNTEAGRVREEIPIYQEGEPLQFAFNARYLSDALKMIGSEDVNIEFTGPLSPGILRPVSDIEYLSLLLPVRLRDE